MRNPLTLALLLLLVLTSVASATAARTLYPAIEPYRTGHLPVSGGHSIYFEESGNPGGMPALFLHGGPGSGTTPLHRRFFDPKRYRIILFDQRGCGKSRPAGSLVENTTPRLIEDIEALRHHLGVKRWLVFGGSWGSFLALAYAEAHPAAVSHLVLRGILLGTQRENDWAYREGGVSWIFPDAWQRFAAHIPEPERADLLGAYVRRLGDPDPLVHLPATRAWAAFSAAMSELRPPAPSPGAPVTKEDLYSARIEAHYYANRSFLESDNQILENVSRIRHVPTVIVHGRFDMICPFETAWRLHLALPKAAFRVVPDAGHAATEPGILTALLDATDRFATRRR